MIRSSRRILAGLFCALLFLAAAAPAASSGYFRHRYVVKDAMTGAPIAGATLTLFTTFEEPAVGQGRGCHTEIADDLPPTRRTAEVSVKTGSSGAVSLTGEQQAIFYPESVRCPPFSPSCQPRPVWQPALEARHPRYKVLRSRFTLERDILLLPKTAAVGDETAAVAAAKKSGRIAGGLSDKGYAPLRTCFERGRWQFYVLGEHDAAVNGSVDGDGRYRLENCPRQGAYVRVGKFSREGIRIREEVTGFGFDCPWRPDIPKACANPQTVFVGEGRPAKTGPARCDESKPWTLTVWGRADPNNRIECLFQGCRRLR